MAHITIDFERKTGKIKPMNAVNNGPIYSRTGDQQRSNLEEFKSLKIPYVRTHDASFCNHYGGEHIVDIQAVFPNFEKDPEDPEAYDFLLTDEYLGDIRLAGAQPYYRLGSKIEHWTKKYGTIPPKDFKKWARVCEHIIKHYNYGWANGFHWNIEYWEIWNEPENIHTCWIGTYEQFYEFFVTAANHLKETFPEIKVGGSGFDPHDYNDEYLKAFLNRMTRDSRTPMDFFSWHNYTNDPREYGKFAVKMRALLDRYGYSETQTHLNEWNYVRGWKEDFVYSIEQIIDIKGATYDCAVMAVCQNAPVDLLMYYDARPCPFNGIFDFYTLKPRKGYYAFKIFAELAEQKDQVCAQSDDDDIYTLAAKGDREISMICYFAEDDHAPDKKVNVTINGTAKGPYTLYLLDSEKNYEEIGQVQSQFEITMTPNSVIVLK